MSGGEPGTPTLKCPAWRVAPLELSVDAGQNPVLLLRAEDGSLGGVLCVADTGYHYSGLAKEQLGLALDKFAGKGWAPDRIESAIVGGADTAKWKISKLRNLTRALGLDAKEFDINGLFYRKIYFDPESGEANVFREAANPDHWNPARARLSLEDSSRAFSDGQAGGVVANATRFFRDKNIFAALEGLVIPHHLENTPREPLYVWSSACSNGAETYSLAMFIHRRLEELKAKTRFMVFGTDINPHLVDTAKAGIYQLIRSDLERNRPYFERYGELDGPSFAFGRQIREHVSFRVFDLKNRPRKYRFRLIVCANVFQYYSEEARRFFLENFIAVSRRPGYIYVGHAGDATIDGLNLAREPGYKIFTAR
jgi:chemotaxis protein methyltransferase CheR